MPEGLTAIAHGAPGLGEALLAGTLEPVWPSIRCFAVRVDHWM